jgi:hypothetical protein
MKMRIGLFSVIWFALFTAKAQAAEVHVNVNIGAPPPIIVRSAPTMVYLAEPAAYVAVGIPYDLYFVGGRYYYFRGDNWYWAPGYSGPWNYVVYSSLPPGLRKFRTVRLHEFRDREYREYRISSREYRDRYNDRYFVADYGRSGKSHGNGRGRGHNKH